MIGECLLALAVAAIVTLAATPLAANVARRIGFYDHPVGYKAHCRAIPYLGGIAVFAGFAAAIAVTGAVAEDRLWVLVACGAGLLAVGTLDDRLALMPRWRVLAELVAAVVLTEAGLGWTLFDSEMANFALTAVWVVGVVNAFNLMDNLDGAAATVGGVSAAGIGALALVLGDAAVAVLAFAVAGACAGFLPHNLSRPARIFLGDGGSMSLGFLVSAAVIAAAQADGLGSSALLAGAMLVGLPILDTALVVVSRSRDGIPLVRAGRDHLTHRILDRLGSPHRVACALAAAQACLCALAVAGEHLGPRPLSMFAALCMAAGLVALVMLDSPGWKPARPRPEPERAEEISAFELMLEPPEPSRAEAS